MAAPTDINLHKASLALATFKRNLLGGPLRFQASDLQAVLHMQRDLRDLRIVMVRLALGHDLNEAGVNEYLTKHSDEWITDPPLKDRPDATSIVDCDDDHPPRLGTKHGTGPGLGNRFSIYLGSQIIAWRRRLGIPREEIRLRSQVGLTTLDKMEAGFNRCPRWSTIAAVADAMGAIPVIEFLEQDEFDRRYEALKVLMTPAQTIKAEQPVEATA